MMTEKIVSNRNACSGKLILYVTALVVLAGCQLGPPPAPLEDQDIKQLRKAANYGDAEAQYKLGLRYDSAFDSYQGVAMDDSKAVEWYRKAAEQGHAQAQVALSNMYARGGGVPQNTTEMTEKWLKKAAAQGHADAQYRLAERYYDGHGVPRSYTEMTKWLKKAAAQGHADAQGALAQVYQMDTAGMPRDYIKAYAWLSLAVVKEQGYREAKYKLATKMTPEQIAQAQQLAAKLRKTIEYSQSD